MEPRSPGCCSGCFRTLFGTKPGEIHRCTRCNMNTGMVTQDVANAMLARPATAGDGVLLVAKGNNPLTENYNIARPEAPDPSPYAVAAAATYGVTPTTMKALKAGRPYPKSEIFPGGSTLTPSTTVKIDYTDWYDPDID